MDKKRYKNTRYQNIYKNIKNGNYIIRISNPDTTISKDKNNNKIYSDTLLRKYFNEFIEKAGVPKIRMYDLRHSYVTSMMNLGYEIYAISKNIGHNDIRTTSNVYGHLSEKLRKEMAKSTDVFY